MHTMHVEFRGWSLDRSIASLGCSIKKGCGLKSYPHHSTRWFRGEVIPVLFALDCLYRKYKQARRDGADIDEPVLVVHLTDDGHVIRFFPLITE
jgi:hypothetical protein